MVHNHRIIPGYMGGEYVDGNVAVLSVRRHALAHKWLYMLLGNWQDKFAWLALSGRIGKEEIIRKLVSEAMKGNNHRHGKHLSEEHKKKISEAISGIKHWTYNKEFSEEHKKNISKSTKKRFEDPKNHPFYGKHLSEEHKKKISESHLGMKLSEETKKKVGESSKKRFEDPKNHPLYGKRGKDSPRYGMKHSEESKKKMSKAWDNKIFIKCPYCGVESKSRSNMNRYHFDNCKKRMNK